MITFLSRRTTANAALFLTLTALFWAGNHVVGRWASAHIPPVTLACLRWTGATALLAIFAWRYLRDDWDVIRARWPLLVLLGIVGGGMFNTLQYIALVHTTATSAAILNSAIPVLVVLMGFVVLGQRVRALQLLGIAISLLGVLTVLSNGDPLILLHMQLNKGDLVMLLATAFWALYSVLLQRRPQMHPLSFALFTFAVAALINIPFALIELARGAHIDVTPRLLAGLGYIVVFPSLLAYLLFNRGVEIIGAARSGVFAHLVPMFTAILALVFLGEQPTIFHAAGFALILLGVWLGSRAAPAAASDQA